ncbi:MAG: hypothetical protein KBF21_03150 [Thermoanaerobaculia bacterium]|jgi:hypothetical protein|nr:hypothetical protein [Thermoanaerobaculia bacterium]MBP9823200.1 hypothetical protein [Thermoanaerobaculia bacterium]
MKVRIPFATLAIAAVVASSVVFAQGGPGAGAGSGTGQHNCQGRHAGGPPAYDRAAETTVAGRVAELLPQPCACGGLHLRLTTADGDIEVALGPSQYLADIGAAFLPQDEIRVIGAKPSNAAPADFLARSISKGDATFELRDAEGKPRWAGAGMACPMHKDRGAANAG